MKGRLVGFAVIALLFFALFATNVPAADNLAKTQVLNMGFDAGDAKSLDPHFAATTVDRATDDMIFNGLVRYPLGNQVGFEPDLAESWKVSEDGKVWTFNLRKGVLFHPFPGNDGYEMTSDDVVFSLQRASDAKTSAYASEYTGLEFKAAGPNTVQITLQKPMSETLFLAKVSNYAGGFVVCKKAIEAQGNDWYKMHPVGTGPFIFKSYEPQQKTTLVGNPKYFRGKPVLEEVVVRYMPSVSSRELALRTGELDIIEGLKEEQWMQKIATFPLVSVKAFAPCEVQMLYFNMTKKPFDDIRVRKAFCYAVARDEVAAFMGKSLAEPIYSAALAPPAPGALTKEEAEKAGVVYENNLEKAKQLLTEAGFPNGFETEAIVSEMDSSYRKPMLALQAQVKKAGINLKLKVVEHSSFHTLVRQDASPLVYYASWRPNADVYLTRFNHSDSVVAVGKKPDTNFSHYGLVDADGDGKVESIDQLIEQARWELDSKKQNQLWAQAQIQALKDVSVLPTIKLKYNFPMKSYIDLGSPLEFIWQTYSPQISEKTRILAH